MTKQDAKKVEIVTNLIHEYHVPLSLYQQQLNEDCARRILAELEAMRKAMSNKAPWQDSPLRDWSICGMNHYYVAGEKFLYVSMTKGNICIKEEGKDDHCLWNRLCHKAMDLIDEVSDD